MKKGCFVKSIITLTVITAVIIYLVKNHWNDWVVTPGKKFVVNTAMNSVKDDLESLDNSPFKDSLEVDLKNYLTKKFEKTQTITDNDLAFIVDSIQSAASDSIITKEEYLNIKQILKSKSLK